MIRFIRVTKEYDSAGPALRDFSLEIQKGEFVFLTGHSGSGKTTTLKLIHLSERPSDGEVRVAGFSSIRTGSRDLWKVRRRVGFVFQDFRLLPGRTAKENVAFALEVTGESPKSVSAKSQRLLSQVGLAAKTDRLVEQLSGGERQRVAIARALATEPLILLADEPTGNLDDRAARGIMDLFTEINALGMTVVMATHDMEIVQRYKQARVLELDQGALVFDSTHQGISHAVTHAS